MPTNILMPALSPTMEKGNLARWLKKEGDKIKSGDVIAEIETDKATMEYEAVDEGTLAKIVVPEGTQDVAVNAVIAVLAGEGEDVKAAASARRSCAGGKSAEAPKPQAAPPKAAAPAPQSAPAPKPAVPSAPQPAQAPRSEGSNRIFSSPLARRLAKDAGLDLTRVPGLRPAWPRHRARYRGREIRQGLSPAPAPRRPAGHDRAVNVRRANPRALRGRLLRTRAA